MTAFLQIKLLVFDYVFLYSSQAIPGVGAHLHTPRHHGWLRHPTPSHHRGLEHPTPSYHLLKDVVTASGFATKLTLFFSDRRILCANERILCAAAGRVPMFVMTRVSQLLWDWVRLPRTDSRFDSKSLMSSTGWWCLGVSGGRAHPWSALGSGAPHPWASRWCPRVWGWCGPPCTPGTAWEGYYVLCLMMYLMLYLMSYDLWLMSYLMSYVTWSHGFGVCLVFST